MTPITTNTQEVKICLREISPIVPLLDVSIPNENRSHSSQSALLQTEKQESQPCEHEPCSAYQGLGCYDRLTGGHQRSCNCEACCSQRKTIQEDECTQHSEGNRWQDLSKPRRPEFAKIYDRLSSSQNLSDTLRWYPTDEDLPCVLRRFRSSNQGYAGQARVHYGHAQDTNYPSQHTHGMSRHDKIPGSKIISPTPKTWLQKIETQLSENIYESSRKYPIGSSHDQLNNLPPKIDPTRTTFGKPTEKEVNVGELINPPKNRFEIEREHKTWHHLYKKTHENYDPGEPICRNYEGLGFKRTNTFGDLTPHDIAGRPAARAIGTWRTCSTDPQCVSKFYGDHVDQRLPKLGLPLDRLCGFRDRGINYTYGKPSDRQEVKIPDLIFNRNPQVGKDKSIQIMQNLKEWIHKVRISPHSDLEGLYEGFKDEDKEHCGQIEWTPFMKCLIQNAIPRTMEPLQFLEALAFIQVFQPVPVNRVNYNLIMDLIYGYLDPLFPSNVLSLKPFYCPYSNGSIHFRTTYSDLTANCCRKPACLELRKDEKLHGMPSVRKDKVPAKFRSSRDSTNFGDDGDSYSLIFPSVYTIRGVTVRDAFREISREEIGRVLCKAGINVTHATVDAAWAEASSMDPDSKGRVCFQTFREALDKVQTAELDAVGLTYETELTDCKV